MATASGAPVANAGKKAGGGRRGAAKRRTGAEREPVAPKIGVGIPPAAVGVSEEPTDGPSIEGTIEKAAYPGGRETGWWSGRSSSRWIFEHIQYFAL